MVIQELGWDSDVDDDVRVMIEDSIDGELIEEAVEAVDVVLLWWRDGDGDLVDGLVDALTDLSDAGYIWLMTPKVGRMVTWTRLIIAEAAVTAGLALTNSASVSADWAATRLVRPGVLAGERPANGTPAPDFITRNQHGERSLCPHCAVTRR